MTNEELRNLLKEELKNINKEEEASKNYITIQNAINELKTDMHDMNAGLREELLLHIEALSEKIMDPEKGLIVETNKNSGFRRKTNEKFASDDVIIDSLEKETRELRNSIENLERFKERIDKTLWIVIASVLGMIVKLIFNDIY